MLSTHSFRHIVESTPLVSIDLLVLNSDSQYLLGYRKNSPAKHTWFVPGGRILKDEVFSDAFHRLTLKELGIALQPSDAAFQGVYQHLYPDSFLDESISTHYIVLAYSLSVGDSFTCLPKDEHEAYRWLSADEIIMDDQVHGNVKAYFVNTASLEGGLDAKPGENAVIFASEST